MGGSRRHGREPCTPMLVHGGTLSYLLLIRSIHLGTSLPLRRVLLRLVRPGTPGRAGGRSLLLHLRWWTRVFEEGPTLKCSGESAGGGGEEAAAGVRLPFPRPPPALPLPVFFRPPLPLGSSSVVGRGEEITSSKALRRARGGSA